MGVKIARMNKFVLKVLYLVRKNLRVGILTGKKFSQSVNVMQFAEIASCIADFVMA